MHGLACDMVFILWYFLYIDVMVIDLHLNYDKLLQMKKDGLITLICFCVIILRWKKLLYDDVADSLWLCELNMIASMLLICRCNATYIIVWSVFFMIPSLSCGKCDL